jgi:hypothetical protein
MIAEKIWRVSVFCFCVACADPSQEEEPDTNIARDADESDVVQDQDTDKPEDAVETQDFDVYDISDTTIHEFVDAPDDFQELEDVQDEEEVRDTTEPTWDIDEEIRNSTGYQECLAQYNDVVQQALQDLPDMPEPEPDETFDTFTQLSLGQNHGCALRTDGSIYCWGDNRHRQSEPPTEGYFVQVVSRRNTSCALEDTGRAVCWGEDANDEIPGLYRQIAAGCGIRTEGSAYCWDFLFNTGDTLEGDFVYISMSRDLCLINRQREAFCISPIGVPDTEIPDLDFISIQSNYDTHCGETPDHRMVCWNSDIPLIRNENRRIHLYRLRESEDYIAIYQDNTWEWGGEYSGYSLESYDQLDRTQFIDIDTNETQHCAIDAQGLLQCWTKRGYKKQNLLYDRFLDYEFECSVMIDHTLHCEEGDYDNFSRTTNILFDKVEYASIAKAGISQNKDVYYWADTFEGGPDESDVYYFQGPYENIITEFEYFCGVNENGHDECQCLCYPGYDVCPIDCNERALFLYQNFHQINTNCGINNSGSINCWYFRDFEIYSTELNNQYAIFRFTGPSFCGITCEGYIECEGTQSYYNRNKVFKEIGAYNYPVQHFCSIDVFGQLSCESPEEIYTFNGKFSKLISSNNTLCAQRENGSVFCLGHQKGGK